MNWIVVVTTNGCSSEDGNINYCSFLSFPTEEEALAACREAMPHEHEEERYANGEWDFTDNAENWLCIRKAADGILLNVDPEDYCEDGEE